MKMVDWRRAGALALLLHAAPALGMDRDGAQAQLKATGIAAVPAALVQYAALGDSATVLLLVEAGVSVNQSESLRQVSALHNAAAQGHLRLAQRLLELGARVDAEDWNGVTPLIGAVAGGHRKVVELLLARGGNANALPHRAPTALICAIELGEPALVEVLLKAGASAALADAFGRTPLAAAALGGRSEIVKRLEAALAMAGPR